MLVCDQAEDFRSVRAWRAVEEREFEDEGAGDELGAGGLDEVAAGAHGAAGGEHVVDQEDAAAGRRGRRCGSPGGRLPYSSWYSWAIVA